MMSRVLKLIGQTCLAVAVVTLATACENAFDELSVKNTNDAYYYDALRLIDQRDYNSAITKLLALTDDFKAKREVTSTIASAYAGRCGLDMLSLVQSIDSNSSSRLFPILLLNFKAATTASVDDCMEAETWMRKLAPGDDFTKLTADENVFLALTSFAKIGAILGTYADNDDDGVADPAFDSCNTSQLPDSKAREVGVGVNLALSALAASGSDVVSGMLDSVTSTCSSLPAGLNFCGTYDGTAFTTQEVQALGGLIRSQDAVGLGTCADTLPNCVCP
jgi:hypothetical protein